jgi:hypothetical protein
MTRRNQMLAEQTPSRPSFQVATHMHAEGINARHATAVTLVIGLLLGALFNLLWSHFPPLAALGLWPLGLGVACVGRVLGQLRRGAAPAWGLAIAGQALGLLGLGLLFLAQLLG